MTLPLKRQQIIDHAITLRKQGWTVRAIAKELGVCKSSIANWVSIVTYNDNGQTRNTSKYITPINGTFFISPQVRAMRSCSNLRINGLNTLTNGAIWHVLGHGQQQQ